MPLVFQYVYGYSDEGGENGDGEEKREWRLPALSYADDLVLYGESKEDLKAIVERFVEVCTRRGLKVNAGKTKGMMLKGDEGLECEASVDGMRLEHASEFKYLGCVLDESSTNEAGLQMLLGFG